MEDGLRRFHPFNDVFLLRGAGKVVKVKANTLRTELVKKRMVDGESNDETWMPSKKLCEINAWRDYVSHKIDVSWS